MKKLAVISLMLLATFASSVARASTGIPFVDQQCPCSGAWSGHAEYVSCVARALSSIENKRVIVNAMKDATRSSCGGKRDNSGTSTVIGPAGGTVTLPGRATITFPPDAFPDDTTVSIDITLDADTAVEYKNTTLIFQASALRTEEIRV